MKLSFRYRYIEKHDDTEWIAYEEADVETIFQPEFYLGFNRIESKILYACPMNTKAPQYRGLSCP
jgi:hypothetical protein